MNGRDEAVRIAGGRNMIGTAEPVIAADGAHTNIPVTT